MRERPRVVRRDASTARLAHEHALRLELDPQWAVCPRAASSTRRTYSGSPTAADSLLLPSIAAVLIGGTAMSGGVGGLVRTLIGALAITVLRAGIAAAGVDPAFEPIAYGVLVVIVVALTTDRSGVSWP